MLFVKGRIKFYHWVAPSHNKVIGIIILIINIIIIIVVVILIINLLILVVVSLVRVRLDREGEEVEAGLVGDEQGEGAVPPIPRVGHRVLKEDPGLADPGEAAGSDGTETNDVFRLGSPCRAGAPGWSDPPLRVQTNQPDLSNWKW